MVYTLFWTCSSANSANMAFDGVPGIPRWFSELSFPGKSGEDHAGRAKFLIKAIIHGIQSGAGTISKTETPSGENVAVMPRSCFHKETLS